MEQIVICFSMVQIFTNLRQKNSEIVASPLCLGNISKNWSIDNVKKKQALMVMSMILVLITMLMMLMILKTLIRI